MTMKVAETGSFGDLNDLFQRQIEKFCTHIFNIRHQQRQYQLLRREMSTNEVLIHVNFAENYVAKLPSAVQSAHFGASQHQIALHTGVYYIGANSSSHTFCSVSDSLQHAPAAIWTHLTPVLDDVIRNNGPMDCVHIFSDRPSAQYRQKLNFFIMSNVLHSKGIPRATWNFFESGHGKGITDGVGAAVKRAADRRVLAQALWDQMKMTESSVLLYYIDSSDVERNVNQLSAAKVTPVPKNSVTLMHRMTRRSPLQEVIQLRKLMFRLN